jgi:hypothetical protein
MVLPRNYSTLYKVRTCPPSFSNFPAGPGWAWRRTKRGAQGGGNLAGTIGPRRPRRSRRADEGLQLERGLGRVGGRGFLLTSPRGLRRRPDRTAGLEGVGLAVDFPTGEDSLMRAVCPRDEVDSRVRRGCAADGGKGRATPASIGGG